MRRLKDILFIVVMLFLFGSAGYRMFKKHATDQVPERDFVHIKAVIIDDRNYEPNSPVKPTFSYSYMFKVGNDVYKNNAQDPGLKIGDSIEVAYDKDFPNLNKPMHPKD